jgi:putative transposase
MSSSYVSNHVHIVFSTKNRLKMIPEDLQPKLWAYMAGIAKKHSMHAVAIGGIEDHAHALIDMGPTLGIAKAVQVLKANSSRWINDHPGVRFGWQEGYFACSVSRSPGADGEAVHCKPKSAPSKVRLCNRVQVVVEEAWI